MKENKKLILSIAFVLLLGIVIAGATFAYYTWTSNAADKTNVTFQVPSGSNQLKAILDANTTTISGIGPAANCAGTYSKMVTIQLYYQNETGADASLDATLKLASISEAANSNTYKSVIKWALSTSGEKSTCNANIIEQGTLNNVAINGEIYSGDLTAGTIPGNTAMGLKKTLYLYFWIDGPNYNVTNTGNNVVNDPLQDLSLKVVWEGTISNAPSASWHYDSDIYNSSDCGLSRPGGCSFECNRKYSAFVWSCIASSSVAPSAPSLEDGRYCWCQY